MFARAPDARRLHLVWMRVTETPANLVQRQMRERVLDESLVDARAPRGETARSVSLQTLRRTRAQAWNAKL